MNPHARIASLFRELAEAFDSLSAEERKPSPKQRREKLNAESAAAVSIVKESLARGGIKVA